MAQRATPVITPASGVLCSPGAPRLVAYYSRLRTAGPGSRAHPRILHWFDAWERVLATQGASDSHRLGLRQGLLRKAFMLRYAMILTLRSAMMSEAPVVRSFAASFRAGL